MPNYSEPPATQYNNGYGKEFSERYGGRFTVLPRIEQAIHDAVERVAAHKPGEEITILDFGCGSGRYLGVLESLAAQGLKIRYVGVDVAEEVLGEFEANLQELKFQRSGGANLGYLPTGGEKQAYHGPSYAKGNVEVELLHVRVDEPAETIQRLLQESLGEDKVDVSLCLFGALSHIAGRKNRQNVLRLLGEVTEGPTLLSVPNTASNQKDYEEFNRKRANGGNVGLASEPHSIFYERELRDGAKANLFYYLYDTARLRACNELAII